MTFDSEIVLRSGGGYAGLEQDAMSEQSCSVLRTAGLEVCECTHACVCLNPSSAEIFYAVHFICEGLFL